MASKSRTRTNSSTTGVSRSLLTTALDDPRAERARRSAMQSYVEGRTTYAQAEERVRKAIERYSTPAE